MAASTFLRLCFTLVILLASAAALAQPVVVERDTPLQAEPRPDAPVVATLKSGTQGQALATKGPWLNVKTGSATGWLYSFNVRFVSAQSGSGGAGTASALGRVAGSRQPLAVTSTIGVRGLDPEMLRNAQFNEAQVAQLERYTASNDQARSGAAASGLKAARIDYLDAK